MKMKFINIIYSLLFLTFITSYFTTNNATSTIVGISYDEKKNTTDYVVIPYGSLSIPGEWDSKYFC